MKNLSLLFMISLLLVACSQKSYYEPVEEERAAMSQKSADFANSIVNLSRDGATLSDGKFITKKGVSNVGAGEGFRFLTQSGSHLLASHPDGTLKIMSKRSGKVLRSVQMHSPIVSATVKGNLIAYVLSNNAFGLYDIRAGEKLTESRSDKAYAIDTRAASPIFIASLAVMPMLDGKLVIVDSQNVENTKVIYLSNSSAFNNIIHLSRVGNTMIAATPKKVVTIGVSEQQELDANVFDIVLSKGSIYLFTKEGDMKKLNLGLHVRASKRLEYANFSAVKVANNKVYALDITGALVVSNTNFTKQKVYDVDEVESKIYMTQDTLYKDGEMIDLSLLNYE
jgi:predicted RNA binding protein YcfA (HicA-like mRNA interferase family)